MGLGGRQVTKVVLLPQWVLRAMCAVVFECPEPLCEALLAQRGAASVCALCVVRIASDRHSGSHG